MNFSTFLRNLIGSVPGKIISGGRQLANRYFELAIPIRIASPALIAIVLFFYQIIRNPTGAVNTFMIFLFDNFYNYFLTTPEQFKVVSLLNSFAVEYPDIGWGVVYEIFSGMAGLFSLWAAVKIFKILPFT